MIGSVSPPLRAGGNETGGDRPPGTDVDTVESLIPQKYVPDIVPQAMSAKWSKGSSGPAGDEVANLVAFGESAFSFKASHFTRDKDGAPAPVFPPLSADADKGDQDPLVCAPIAFTGKDYGADADPVSPTLRSMGHDGSHANGGGQVAVAQPVVFQPRYARNGRGAPDTVASALTSEAGETGKGDSAQCVATAWAVRRLTPVECERLQALPDGYTDVPWRGADGAPDGPRYKALGNSMSANVMRWIGVRIDMVDKLMDECEN